MTTLVRSGGWVRQLALVVVGAAVGAGASLAIGSTQNEDLRISARNADPGRPPVVVELQETPHLEARLRELERRAQAAASAAASPQERPVEAEQESTLEERKAEFELKIRQSLDAFRAEPVDSAWSRKTSALINSDLASLSADRQFNVVSMECRTTNCLARLTWKTTDEATRDYRELMHHRYAANCTRSILLDDEPDSFGEQKGMLFFECESWRAGGEPLAEERTSAR